jgi:hypothetical protein
MPIRGRVVSAGSSAPLAGARVFVTWEAEVDAFAHSQRAPIRACQTTSAADGSYSVRGWRAKTNLTSNGGVRATAYAYLDGYRMSALDPVEHVGTDVAVLYMTTSAATGPQGRAPPDVAGCSAIPGT